MTWRFVFDARARRDLLALDKAVQKRIIRRLESLGADPLRAMTRLVAGDPQNPEFKLRVGDYRLICVCEEQGLVIMVKVDHRSRVYDG